MKSNYATSTTQNGTKVSCLETKFRTMRDAIPISNYFLKEKQEMEVLLKNFFSSRTDFQQKNGCLKKKINDHFLVHCKEISARQTQDPAILKNVL